MTLLDWLEKDIRQRADAAADNRERYPGRAAELNADLDVLRRAAIEITTARINIRKVEAEIAILTTEQTKVAAEVILLQHQQRIVFREEQRILLPEELATEVHRLKGQLSATREQNRKLRGKVKLLTPTVPSERKKRAR